MNKIKNSLIKQVGFLFLLSFIVIISLWIFFYIQQRNQHLEYDIGRYFYTATIFQNYLNRLEKIPERELNILEMKLSKDSFLKKNIILEKGDRDKGFKVISSNKKWYLFVRVQNNSLLFEDISTHKSMVALHLIFLILLFTQAILYFKLKKLLNPISLLKVKLEKLKDRDFSPLNIESNYEEIKQIISSYNTSVSKIKHILELREMFNKIFMHEMKMPLAKGMFYLKQEPSSFTHNKLNTILKGLNIQLNEFSKIESLIAHQTQIDNREHLFMELLNIVKSRILINEQSITIKNCENYKLKGDKEFWVLCIKNIIDNALKYSVDNRLYIYVENETLSFKNRGEPLPIDITTDIKHWKLDKSKRHKSSTGYGFGLFIIKNIITMHNYKLEYIYNKENKEVILKISNKEFLIVSKN